MASCVLHDPSPLSCASGGQVCPFLPSRLWCGVSLLSILKKILDEVHINVGHVSLAWIFRGLGNGLFLKHKANNALEVSHKQPGSELVNGIDSAALKAAIRLACPGGFLLCPNSSISE